MNDKKLSVLVAALLALLLLGCAAMQRWAAPKFEGKGPHEGAAKMTKEQCFSCHMQGKDGAPKAPESMYEKTDCSGCHLSR